MYARLHMDHVPTPLPNQPTHKTTTFGDRVRDDSENVISSPPKKPRTHYSIASIFDRYRKPNVNEDESSIDHMRAFRYQPSPSPEPEPSMVAELTTRYAELRTTLHSSIITRLEEAQEELVKQAVDSIRTRQVGLAQLEARSRQLHSPLRTAKIDYEALGEDGQRRQTTVAIDDAIRAFEQKLDSATTEIAGLWAT